MKVVEILRKMTLISHSRNYENSRNPMDMARPVGGVGPLCNREVVRAVGGIDSRESKKGEEISEHIVTDALWISTPSIIRYRVAQHYIKLSLGSPGESTGAEESDNPFSHPPGAPASRIEDGSVLYRDGAADVPALGAESDSSSSRFPQLAYRSFPETDSVPAQRGIRGELLRLQPYQRDPNDPARAARIARLRDSTAAYEDEGRVRGWNPPATD